MRRSIGLLYMLCFSTLVSFGQERLSIDVDSMGFEEILDYLRTDYGIDFSYDSDLSVEGFFSIENEADDIEELLAPLWSSTTLDCHYLADDHLLLRTRRIPLESIRYRFFIKDKKTDSPLELVAISTGDGVGTYTDMEGGASLFFKNNDPPQSVSVHLLGYESLELGLTDDRSVEIALSPLEMDIDEVVITGRIQPVQYLDDQAITMRDNDAMDLISSMGEPDVLRSVQLLPGISAHSDRSAGVQIRGGEADQTLIMLDDMPLYNPYHYYGIYSAVNDAYIDQVDVYKNTVPVQYGSGSNGMVMMTSQPSDESLSGEISLSTLASSVAVDATVGDVLSIQGSARASYQNIYDGNNQNPQDILSRSQGSLLRSNPDFSFYDYNGKIALTPADGHQLTLNLYRSADDLLDEYQYTQRPRDRRLVLLEESYSNSEIWNNKSYSINYTGEMTERLKWTTAYHSSNYDNANLQSLVVSTEFRNSSRQGEFSYSQNNDVSDHGLKSMLSYDVRDKVTLSAGAQSNWYDADLTISRTNRPNDLLVQNEASVLSGFGDVRIDDWQGWTADVGVRMDHLSTTDEVYFSPRLTFSKQLDSDLLVKGSISQQFQFLREFQIETANGRSLSVWSIANQDRIPVIKVNHIMAGLRYTYDRWSLDVEAYLNNTAGVLEYAFVRAPVNDQQQIMPSNNFRLYQGDGITRGVDVLLRYTGDAYSSWLSYTLSKSTNSFREVARGADFPSQLDRRHQLKWINSYETGRWTFSTSMIYSSGRPYTDISRLLGATSREDLSPENRISRLPDYIRQDIGAQYALDLGDQELTFGLSIFNLWDRANVDYIQYIYSIDAESIGRNNRQNVVIGTETPLLGRTLNAQVTYRF